MPGQYYSPSTGLGMMTALQEELTRREEQRRRDEEERLARERESRLEESSRRQQQSVEQQRERQNLQWTYENAPRGTGVDPTTASRFRSQGMESLLKQMPATQGAHKGVDESGIDQYDVTPGILDFGDTPLMTQMKTKRADDETARLREQQRVQNAMLFPGTPDDARNYMGATGELAPAGMYNQKDANAVQPGSFAEYMSPGATPERRAAIIAGRKEYQGADDRPAQPVVLNIPGYGVNVIDRERGTGRPVTGPGGQSFGALPDDAPSEWNNVIGRVVDNLPTTKRGQKIATFGRLLTEGNTKELADQVRQTAIEGENVDLKNQITNRDNMKAALGDVQNILGELKANGVPTNIFAGSVEDGLRKLGATSNPMYVRLGNRLADTLITYRRAATGVAFGEREQEDYEKMFPNYRNLPGVNDALIKGMLESIGAIDNAYWTRKLGPEGAQLVMGSQGSSAAPARGNGKTSGRFEILESN